MKLSEELTRRGFVQQYSTETLEEIVDGAKRTVYHGIDPTADSIHAGNFANFMLLRHLVTAGHKVILLIGGGTGMIGDPKPDVERPLTPPEVIAERVEKLHTQASKLLGSDTIEFVNNHDWLSSLDLIGFLRDIGKHFTVNELIKKEAIAARLKSENGISYTEFAYPLLQAYDYLNLHRQHGCDLQVGGSDQWGNIIAGVDLIRRKEGATAYALTIPLVIDKATSKKFGKSEGNAVWLDPLKTSPYDFYQFWLNTSDESTVDYLKLFTLLSLDEIDEIASAFKADPATRSAQKRLAREVTALVHGAETADAVRQASEILFEGGGMANVTPEAKRILTENAPTYAVEGSQSLIEVLVGAGLAGSKREAREFIDAGAVSLDGEKPTDPDTMVTISDTSLLKRGKRHVVVLLPH